MAKLLAAVVGGLVLLVELFFALVLVRKSMPYVLKGDLEQLAASGPYNSARLASEICGTPVDMLGSAETSSPVLALPRARLLSPWRILYPLTGTAAARITGVGTRKPDWRDPQSDYTTVMANCEGVITFKYRCVWAWNGRATVLETEFLEPPKVEPRP